MRNILKGLLKPEAEVYVLPDADEIRFDDEEELIDPPAEEEEQQPLSLDITLGEEEPAVETPPEPEPETPVRYAQLQAELIMNQAREDAQRLLEQAREQAEQEQEEIRAGARDEGYRDGYAQGIAKAMEDSVRDREATAARLEKEVQDFLEKASLARDEMLLQSRDELLELCLSVAEKVVRVSLKSSSEVIVRMISWRPRRKLWTPVCLPRCPIFGMCSETRWAHSGSRGEACVSRTDSRCSLRRDGGPDRKNREYRRHVN